MNNDIAGIRKTYASATLSEADMAADPVSQFDKWWKEAVNANLLEVNAMTLATASADGFPSARIVLLKGFDTAGFAFFTNYESFKGRQLEENPRACLVFFWKELERQVRITGVVQKTTGAESEEYFQSRPKGSQAGAAVSPQSRVIESREWLEHQYTEFENAHGDDHINRPGYWGGYRVAPVVVEFWQGRPSRLHDRMQYTLQDDGNWELVRLAP
ncbi:MAG: pyridoxamine 5'-phosphate oxidase [Chitinophagaceae bacterium]|nr:MAG: pyridoxamine 5'-phosphate oxidase [Chitinophagaceae bacterium]